MSFRDYSLAPASNTTLADGTYIGPNMLRNKVRPALQQFAADGKELSVLLDANVIQAAQAKAAGAAASQYAAAAAASRADALTHSQTAGAYLAAINDAVEGLPAEATLPLQAATRTALAAFTGMTAGRQAILTEAGREGLFVWSVLNESANVTADPYQGIYVAPAATPTGASGAWVRVVVNSTGYASWFGTTAYPTNDAPRINAALASSRLKTVLLDAVTYGVSQSIYVPNGKALRGASRELTILKCPNWTDWAHNRVITGGSGGTEDYDIDGMQVSDLQVDGNKIGLGGGSGTRITAISPTGRNFLVERCWARNCTGYLYYARGASAYGIRAGGTFRDCLGENGDTIFEATYADVVLLDNCHGRDGDGDVPCEAGFIIWARSSNVTVRNSSWIGTAGVGVQAIADGGTDQVNIVFDSLYVDNGANIAFATSGDEGLITHVRTINSVFKSTYMGALLGNTDIEITASTLDGPIAIAMGGEVTLRGEGSKAIGRGPADGAPTYGLYIEGSGETTSARWNGGVLMIESGPSSSQAYTAGVVVSSSTLVTPAIPSANYSYDAGTPVVITAGTGLTAEDFDGGWYRLTKTTSNAAISDAYSAVGALTGPFIMTIIPHSTSEAWFGMTDAATVPASASVDFGFLVQPSQLRQSNGAALTDMLSRPFRYLHIERDADDNLYLYADGATEEQGKIVRTVTAAEHGGDLAGPFKAAFALTEQNQVIDVRVATR